jgi:FixJ family two-component response regulator
MMQEALISETSANKRKPLVIPPTTLLIVDDDTSIRDLLARLAQDMKCVLASTYAEALAILASNEPLHGLVTDARLSDGSGIDLVDRWIASHDAPFLVTTSEDDEWRQANTAANNRDGRFLPKPFTMAEFRAFTTDVHAHRWGLPRSVAKKFVPFVTRHEFKPKRIDLFARLVRKDDRKQIAADLGISLHTLRTRREELLERVGAKSLDRAYEEMMHG